MKESRNKKYNTCFLIFSLIGTTAFFTFSSPHVSPSLSLSHSHWFSHLSIKKLLICSYTFFYTLKFQTILTLSSLFCLLSFQFCLVSLSFGVLVLSSFCCLCRHPSPLKIQWKAVGFSEKKDGECMRDGSIFGLQISTGPISINRPKSGIFPDMAETTPYCWYLFRNEIDVFLYWLSYWYGKYRRYRPVWYGISFPWYIVQNNVVLSELMANHITNVVEMGILTLM